MPNEWTHLTAAIPRPKINAMAKVPVATDHQLETVKTLVYLHGQRKAARIAGLNENTVKNWASKGKWPTCPRNEQPEPKRTLLKAENAIVTQGSTSALIAEVDRCREESRLSLGRYLVKTASEAEQIENGLTITRKAKDLAEIHSRLFPEPKQSATIIQQGISISIRDLPDAPAAD